MHIVLIGNTGSGKTTLGNCLAERLNVPLISSGDVARELAAEDPSTMLALQQGALAPEAAMRVQIRKRIERGDVQRGGWILDGFPRSIPQLIALNQWSAAMPTYVFIDVPEWNCIERLVARSREHDNPDAIARRLETYNEQTLPVIRLLDEGGVLISVDGMAPPDTMAADLEKQLA